VVCGVIARAAAHKRGTARDGMKVVERMWAGKSGWSGATGMQSLLISWFFVPLSIAMAFS